MPYMMAWLNYNNQTLCA